MTRILVTMLVCAAATTGCVSARVSGTVEPGSEDVKFSSLVIYAEIPDEPLRELVERQLAATVGGGKLRATASLDVFVEPKAYTDEEAAKVLEAGGHDGLVRVRLADYANEAYKVPGRVTKIRGAYFAYTVVDPPYWTEHSRLYFALELVERATNRTIWRGKASADGPGYRDIGELARAAGKKLCDQMWQEKLVDLSD